MTSIAFIIPYFGKLPDYLPVWLASCAQNPSIDFYLFTDDIRDFSPPKNVHVIPMTFDEAKALLQQQFDFPICLNRPYKLCDYKPVYGAAFSKWLKNYDFWGHCDVDIIWGNIRHFFTEERLHKYDRLLWQGHCSIYRNSEYMNLAFKTLDRKGCQDWRIVYSKDPVCAFDEYGEHCGGGLSLIMERNGIAMYKEWVFADLCVGLDRFQCAYTENQFYTTEEDSRSCYFERTTEGVYLIYRKNGELRRKEMMYVHFQKRKLNLRCDFHNDGSEAYLLLPPGIVKSIEAPLSDVKAKRQLRCNNTRILWSGIINGMGIVKIMKRVFRKLIRLVSRG